MIPLASDLAAICAGDFGEAVTYRPYGGAAKTISAQVYRQPTTIELIGEGSYGETVLELEFPNDSQTGLTTVHEGQDEVDVQLHQDDSWKTTFRIMRILSQGHGGWHVLAKA